MKHSIIFSLLSVLLMSCTSPKAESQEINLTKKRIANMDTSGLDTATFGGGCFWCVEAIYQQLKGVVSVTSGYSGGQRENPSYEQVCSGATGHAEVVQIVFDPKVISFDELLEVFWTVHDPTTLNRQGADVGTQYRSVIFYNNEQQYLTAKLYKDKLNKEGAFPNPVVTEISPLIKFYKGEGYHQNYYNENENQPYCTLVIKPKIDKFQKVFKSKMK